MTPDENDRRIALEAQRQAGDAARTLLKNPAFDAAFDAVRDQLMKDMAECPLTDRDRHTMLIIAFQQLGMVRGALERAIDDGKIATVRLQQSTTVRPRPYHPPN